MIDINELRRLALDGDLAAMQEIILRLEAAEKERDALRNEIAFVKEVEFPRKAQAVADAWKGKCKRLEVERDNLRARIEEMEKQEPVAEMVDDDFGKQIKGINYWWQLPNGAKLYALPGAKGEDK